MTQKAQHTPTPYNIGNRIDKHKVLQIQGKNQYGNLCPIADICITGNEQANADFIVRACNSHYELLGMLEQIVEVMPTDNGEVCLLKENIDQINVLIDRAKGRL